MSSLEEINFPINRNELYGIYIYLINQQLEVSKRRLAIYYSTHCIPTLSNGKDIYFVTPEYMILHSSIKKIHNSYCLDSFKELKSKYANKIVISDYINLNFLLETFGFDSKIYFSDLEDIKNNIFNGKFGYENCDLFGYQKKADFMWKNGILVPNIEVQGLSDYDIRKYELVDKENKLANFFPLLNEVDYQNPEAIFEPFEEEGPIKKRILVGSDTNV